MRLFWSIAISTLFLAAVALANRPIALVTDIQGRATLGGQAIQLLNTVDSEEQAVLASNSRLVFSYVEGGLRATAQGPCTLKFTEAGPVLISGKKEQLVMSRPPERKGYKLPAGYDVGTGGTIRRGELDLHLSRKLLPGPQEIAFSAMPSLTDFQLVVSNSATYEDVYTQELETGKLFAIPEGILEAGNSYDFALSSSGGKVLEVEAVVVLGDQLASQIDKDYQNLDFPTRMELLGIYLEYSLDAQALACVESLLKERKDNKRLIDIRADLRRLLRYEN